MRATFGVGRLDRWRGVECVTYSFSFARSIGTNGIGAIHYANKTDKTVEDPSREDNLTAMLSIPLTTASY